MIMNATLRLLLATTMTAIIAACQTNEIQGGTYTTELHDSTVTRHGRCMFEVSLELADGDSEASRNINSAISRFCFRCDGMPEAAMQHWHDSLSAEYSQEMEEMQQAIEEDGTPDYIPIADYDYNLTVREIPSEHGLRTFSVDEYTYLGGAHGAYSTVFLHFDAATGQQKGVKQVLGVTAEEALHIAQQAQAYDMGIDINDLEKAGLWPAKEWPATGNFRIDGDSVIFLFNPYEAACYAVGIIEIAVPRSKFPTRQQ